MRRTTIERIIDSLESELGSDADVNEIESRAVHELLNIQQRASALPGPTARYDAVVSEVPVHVRVDDCAGRLASTVVTHAYDKIRRMAAGLPASFRDALSREQATDAVYTLHVHGTAGLMQPLSRADAIELCAAIEQAGIDCGFERINVLTLTAGKSGSAVQYLPLLSGLLPSCPKSTVSVEVGSSAVGIRAAEILAAAAMLLNDIPDASVQSRIELACNVDEASKIFSHQKSHLRIDLTVSVWPILAAMVDEINTTTCYGDRFELISVAGQRAFSRGIALLDRLTASMHGDHGYDGKGRIGFSIDDLLLGPESAEDWTGVPRSTDWDPSASSPAASLLRRGILAGSPASEATDVYADGLPLTDSIRNTFGFYRNMLPAGLAGFLVGAFAGAVVGNRSRSCRLIGVEPPSGQTRVSIMGVPGQVPVVPNHSDWIDEHFTRGGAIIPPLSDNRW